MNKSWSIWGNSISFLEKEISNCFCEKPVVLCLGTPKHLEDSLGPLVGSILKKKYDGFVYGTLDAPISVSNLKFCLDFLRATHKNKKLLVVDASTSKNISRLGTVVFTKNYIPFNKVLKNLEIGADFYLFGVCSLFKNHFPTLTPTKLPIIEKLSKIISNSILKITDKSEKALNCFL